MSSIPPKRPLTPIVRPQDKIQFGKRPPAKQADMVQPKPIRPDDKKPKGDKP